MIEDPSCAPQFDFLSTESTDSTDTCFLPQLSVPGPGCLQRESRESPERKNFNCCWEIPVVPVTGSASHKPLGPSAQALGPYRGPHSPRRVARNCNWKSRFCCLPQQKPNSDTEILVSLETSRKSGSTLKQQQETPQIAETKSKQRQACFVEGRQNWRRWPGWEVSISVFCFIFPSLSLELGSAAEH